MAKKHYLIDTSIILDDPQNILYLYENAKNTLFISDIVLEELDKKKTSSEVGFFAREFFRNITNNDNSPESSIYNQKTNPSILKESSNNPKSITSTLKTPAKNQRPKSLDSKPQNPKHPKHKLPIIPQNGDFIKEIVYEANHIKIPLIVIYRQHYKTNTNVGLNDARIAEIAKDYNLTLLTNDIALKIRSIAKDINAQSLFRDRVENPSDIDFWKTFCLHKDVSTAELSKNKDFKKLSQWSLIRINEQDNTDSALYLTGKTYFGLKVDGKFEALDFDLMLKEANPYVAPMNLEQKMLFALLTHKKNIATIATGSTGSGKTLIALQAGIHLVKQELVDGIIYLRNTVTASDKEAELGFRKGDEEQKLGYFMYPLYSAINFTIDSLQSSSMKHCIEYRGDVNTIEKEDATDYFLKKHNIQVVDIAHARGITIRKKFVIFDEAQNASNATIKLIGTRLGEGSRIVFLGDWTQIDHPYLSRFRNGAVSLLQKALKEDIIAGIQLRQTIRSSIAQWFGESF